jgi:hypothetical protein
MPAHLSTFALILPSHGRLVLRNWYNLGSPDSYIVKIIKDKNHKLSYRNQFENEETKNLIA